MRERQHEAILWPNERYPESHVVREGGGRFCVPMEQGDHGRLFVSVRPVQPKGDLMRTIDVHNKHPVRITLTDKGRVRLRQGKADIIYAPSTARAWACQLLQLAALEAPNRDGERVIRRGTWDGSVNVHTKRWEMVTRSNSLRFTGVGYDTIWMVQEAIKTACTQAVRR